MMTDPQDLPAPPPDLPPPDLPAPDLPAPDLPAPDLPPPDLSSAAARALAEAAERRRLARTVLPPELGGRDGPEPVRYGDWERKGLAVDF